MASKIISFILQPFAKPIRYILLKIMKKIRQPDDERPIIATANHILKDIIFPYIFDIFKSDRFRELAEFKKMPTSEHDRIFNELQIAGISLVVFYLRTVEPLMGPDDYNFWRDVDDRLPRELQKILISYGVDGANAKLMRQLIDMRYEEYEKMKAEVLEVNDEENKNFETLSPELKRIVSTVQAIAVGTAHHIKRGKIKEGDPLIKYLVGCLMFLQKQIGKFVRNL